MKRLNRLGILVLGLTVFSMAGSTMKAGEEDYLYVTNNGSITMTGYTGPGGAVEIPDEIGGLPVTVIDEGVFLDCTNLTSVVIPDNVVALLNPLHDPFWDGPVGPRWFDRGAFQGCTSLTNAIIGAGVTEVGARSFMDCVDLANVTMGARVAVIGERAFSGCASLQHLVLPEGITAIGAGGFSWCTNLISIIIPKSVTGLPSRSAERGSIWPAFPIGTFEGCSSLRGVYFKGNAPELDWRPPFEGCGNLTIYFLPGTIGWDTHYAGHPTVPWVLAYPLILSPNFGIKSNSFGFTSSWATNATVVVEGSSAPGGSVWIPLQTNTLIDGWSYFSDAEWTNHPARFYRVRPL